MHTSRNTPAIAEAYDPLINAHGRDIVEAVIMGGAVASPRSTIPNYAEILVALVVRTPTLAKSWIEGLMSIVSRFALPPDLGLENLQHGYPGDKATAEAKKKFQEAVLR